MGLDFEPRVTGHRLFTDHLFGEPKQKLRIKDSRYVYMSNPTLTSGVDNLKQPKVIKQIDLVDNAIVVRFKDNCNIDQDTISEGEMQDGGLFPKNLLKPYLLDFALSKGATKIILDLSNVNFVHKAGLGAFWGLQKEAEAQGKKLVLFGVDKVPGLQEKLESTQFHKHFIICPDEKAALEA